LLSRRRSKWMTVRSCGLPFGPFALRRIFAPASCLRSPAFDGMTAPVSGRSSHDSLPETRLRSSRPSGTREAPRIRHA
jgi:hypothetical protein